jgi:hypothetical protein
LLIILAQYSDKHDPINGVVDCGIPVVGWCKAICWWSMLYSASSMNIIWLVRYGTNCVVCYLLSSFLIYAIAGIGWTVYGLKMYFSKSNHCPGDFPMIMMVFSLIIGGIMVLLIITLTCLVPCIYYQASSMMRNQQNQQSQMNDEIISRLKRAFYDPERFQTF